MKRVLLAVCGLTPQVITETLYALYQQDRMVDAIRVLTTRDGKDACNAGLLGSNKGQYYQFLSDYGMSSSEIDFAPRHIISVADSYGRELEDISSEEDNSFFLKACMEHTFYLTQERDSTVYFSIAGGRKTMGACLALTAQFYARSWDRIFHVLVSPSEFESSREFYFPRANSDYVKLKNRNGNELFMNTDEAKIDLVSMPFVSIRDRLEDSMLKGPEEPASLLMSLIREQDPCLTIDLPSKKIIWKGKESDLPPARLAVYAFFALRKREATCNRDDCRDCTDCALSFDEIEQRHLEEIAQIHERIADRDLGYNNRGIRALEREALTQYRSKINADLLRAFGPYESRLLQIVSLGSRNSTSYILPLDRSKIRVVI